MTSNPARNVVQRQNGTGVSGNASLSIAPARADEGHMADTKAEPLAASGTANGQSNAESPISTAPPQAPTLAPRSLQNSIASTWAASYNDASDEEEEEGEITEVPMAEPPRNQSVPNLPRVDEDLIMVSPDHKPSTPDIEGMPKPLLVPTGTTNGSPVQEVQNSIALPSQRNGHGPDQGSSAIERASHELATSRYQTRGEIKPGEPTSISNLRPQAPGFIPVSRDVSLDSPTSPPGFPSSAPTANPSATTLHAESREGAPSHQSYANYPVAENHDCSSSFDGHLITITPVRITDGFLVPGPTNGHVLMQPHLDTPHRPQTSLMQSSAMSMTPGPSQPSQPSQTGENKTTAPVQKPKAPRKTQGLKSSMWAS
ncbi:hypothetical protein N0V84_011541 [Fusarium piperis]|uniref:Uncharacterized protein n=1 Tax=Fusarium piperis TaxID=1435070 RepID=A0A9W8W2Y5_9HYPO|nr:hypothetical protein N0V84_011541 [Fusarium piperis]